MKKNVAEIQNKYIKSNPDAIKPKLKTNLQGDISKVESIMRKILGSRSNVPELYRLRGKVSQLLTAIDNSIQDVN